MDIMPTDPLLDDPLLTPEAVASALALYEDDGTTPKVAAVYELTRRRTANPLPALRVGKYLRIRKSELLSWLEARRIGGPPKGQATRGT